MKQFSPINTAVNCLRDTFVSSLIIFSYTADYIIKQLLTQQRASHIKVSVTVAQAQRIQFDIQYSEHAAKLPKLHFHVESVEIRLQEEELQHVLYGLNFKAMHMLLCSSSIRL